MSSGLQLSRREFLAAANAGALLLLLESCSLGPFGRSASGPAIPAGSSAREQGLLLLRQAVRASPDHLAQRAADLVKAKDATKIVEFVRDRIGVVPPLYPEVDPLTFRTWGSAATLRGGQGTLRERADILADMLTRAGFPAKVMIADRPSSLGLTELYRQRAVAFAPDQGKLNDAKTLLREAGFAAPPAQHAFDSGPDPTKTILDAIPASAQQGIVRPDLLPRQVPVVAFDQGGKKHYAFALGDLAVADAAPSRLGSSTDAGVAPKVTITVSALSNPAPGSTTPRGSLIDLVSGTWGMDVLAGHQVLLLFSPILGPKAILDSGLAALPVRVPMLRVQTEVLPADSPPLLSAFGPSITMQGDVLAPSGGGAPAGAGVDGPFGTIRALGDADVKAAIAKAASIKTSANAAAYPEVALDVVITDSGGAPVDGIGAASFVVKEEGKPVPGLTLYSNVANQPRPRVLIVYDTEGADFWSSPAAKAAFDAGLGVAIEGLAAKTPFDVQVVGLATPPTPDGWAAPNAAALTAAFQHTLEHADDPWLAAGGAALDQGVCAIVMASDCVALDTSPSALPTLQRRLMASRVPVFVVPTGNQDEQTIAQLVTLSGGARVDRTDPAAPTKIAALLAPVIPKWVGGAYRLRYQAPAGGPTTRTVTVSLVGKDQLLGTATYQVPDKPLPPPSFVGLYVRIDVQGGLTSFRRLAGAEYGLRGGPQGVVDDPAVVEQTRAAMNGLTTIAFEPGPPTYAAMLDDVISSCLSVEPLWQVWDTGTSDDLLKAISKGVRRIPIALAATLRPGGGDPAALPALTTAIFQERVIGTVAEQHADLAVGLNPVYPITADRQAAFKLSVTTSVAASANEAATFPDSAYARLAGRHLVALLTTDPAAPGNFLKTVPAEKMGAWRAMLNVYQEFHMLVPDAGAVDAFWIVDPQTGVAKAVLIDGTGGGIIRTGCHFDGIDQLAITLAIASIECSWLAAAFPFFCIGINAAAAGMAAAALFTNTHVDKGTPWTLALGIYNPFEAFAGLNAAVGVYLLMITLSSGCS